MNTFWILMIVALVISAAGFYKFIYFISLGYGFSIAAIGVALLALYRGNMSAISVLQSLLFIAYGCRLGGFLLKRELQSASYRDKMKKETKDGSDMKLFVKIAIWVTCALLYVCEVSPVLFRLQNGKSTDGLQVIGFVISLVGLITESLADLQKSVAKKQNPNRFVDTGLYQIVRCPNYLGEVLFWTGVFVSGAGVLSGGLQWAAALFGYIGIVYIMFGGARRLELRQNRTYGEDPAYQKYVKSVPILIPFVPLYSVAKYKWLVG